MAKKNITARKAVEIKSKWAGLGADVVSGVGLAGGRIVLAACVCYTAKVFGREYGVLLSSSNHFT